MFKLLFYSLVSICISVSMELESETFINSRLIYKKANNSVYYYPNVGVIPQNSTITKIQLSIGGQIDRIALTLTSPLGNTFTIDGFGSSTRQLNQQYIVPDGNRIHTIKLATYTKTTGTFFVGIQFLGTTDNSPPFMGSFEHLVQNNQYIYLDYRPIAFYGYIYTTSRSIDGFGVVMAKNV